MPPKKIELLAKFVSCTRVGLLLKIECILPKIIEPPADSVTFSHTYLAQRQFLACIDNII